MLPAFALCLFLFFTLLVVCIYTNHFQAYQQSLLPTLKSFPSSQNHNSVDLFCWMAHNPHIYRHAFYEACHMQKTHFYYNKLFTFLSVAMHAGVRFGCHLLKIADLVRGVLRWRTKTSYTVHVLLAANYDENMWACGCKVRVGMRAVQRVFNFQCRHKTRSVTRPEERPRRPSSVI